MKGGSQDFLQLSSSGYEFEEDNCSLTCASRSLEASDNLTLSSPFGIATKVVQVLFLIIMLTSGTILNILVIYLISRSKKLRTRAFAVAFQIALANLGAVALFGVPLLDLHCGRMHLTHPCRC